jgi:putative transposase
VLVTFIHNDAQVIAACDFFVVVTATFRMLYVFVVMELGTRRILNHSVTAHATAEWTLQQFREAFPGDHAYRFRIHDRASIFSDEVDKEITAMGVQVLQTPVQAPKANSWCERFGGTLRRECLDFLIPFNERHLKLDWVFQPREAAHKSWAGNTCGSKPACVAEYSSPSNPRGPRGSLRCYSRWTPP